MSGRDLIEIEIITLMIKEKIKTNKQSKTKQQQQTDKEQKMVIKSASWESKA